MTATAAEKSSVVKSQFNEPASTDSFPFFAKLPSLLAGPVDGYSQPILLVSKHVPWARNALLSRISQVFGFT
jgi:hypothetical protein